MHKIINNIKLITKHKIYFYKNITIKDLTIKHIVKHIVIKHLYVNRHIFVLISNLNN